MDVVAVGPDNAVWVKTWDQVWTPWTNVNDMLKDSTAPLMVSSEQYRLDIFCISPDGAIWTIHFNKTQWSGWKPWGDNFISEPISAVSDPSGREVFPVGT